MYTHLLIVMQYLFKATTSETRSLRFRTATGLPEAPDTIKGELSVCISQTKIYSFSPALGASSYLWSVTGGASIVSGQGKPTVRVDFSLANSSTALLSVYSINSCGSSNSKSITISVDPNCRIANPDESNKLTVVIDPVIYPNPSPGKINLTFNSNQSEKYSIGIFDITGRLFYAESMIAIKGFNSIEINLVDLPKGIYIFSIKRENGETNILRLVLE
jgi:hypothetical protein